jgi:hypothetical protein
VSFEPGRALIDEKVNPPLTVCTPSVLVKTAHAEVVSQATSLSATPPRMEPSEVNEAVVPETITENTSPEFPTTMHHPAEGQETPPNPIVPVDTFVASHPLPGFVSSSACPDEPTARHMEVDPQLMADAVPDGGLDGGDIDVHVSPYPFDTRAFHPPPPPNALTPMHVVEFGAQLYS